MNSTRGNEGACPLVRSRTASWIRCAHNWLEGWNMQGGCLGIPYYQQFVEFPVHQLFHSLETEIQYPAGGNLKTNNSSLLIPLKFKTGATSVRRDKVILW